MMSCDVTIQLDPSDTRPVLSMELREINNETFLFVATDTRLYKLPLQRCARFDHCNCRLVEPVA